MFIASLFAWWYGAGWAKQVQLVRVSLYKTADLFSIGILAKTLFAPFRQISAASQVNDSLGDKLRAAFDKLFSRIVGMVMRTVMIAIGIVALIGQSVLSAFRLAVWPVIPLMPAIGTILALSGWVPTWI